MRKAYEPEARVRVPSRKDTARWCKGVPGREHVRVWRFLPPWNGPPDRYPCGRWQQDLCSVCGKHLSPFGRRVLPDGSIAS